MIDRSRPFRRVLLLAGFALLAAACNDASTGSPAPTEPPTAPPVETLPPVTTSVTTTSAPTTTLLPPVTTGVPPEGLEAEVLDLIEVAETIRGLGFLTRPEIVVLTPAEFDTRVDLLMEARHDRERDEAMTLLLRLVGRLEAEDDVTELRRALLGTAEHAWYDAANGRLLIVEQAGAMGPLARSEVVHEIVHALADQHYRWAETRSALLSAGADDRLAALDALVEGDATYFQVIYVQQLSDAERQVIAGAYVDPSPAAASAPAWLIEDLAFPFDSGFDFVADLVGVGGIAAVDRAYLDPPTSTEHILHPERYRRGEIGRAVDAGNASIETYTVLPAATMGEWGLRLLLEEALSPGMQTQVSDGWGGDSYLLFRTGGGDVAFGFAYLGDSEAHTVEVTQAFIDFAEDVLGLGDGVRTDGGAVYTRRGRAWMFIDREGPGLVVVIASDSDAGEELAGQLTPPQ